jgi:hypothetical protein
MPSQADAKATLFSEGGLTFLHDWRSAVAGAVAQTHTVLEAIVPFGFEATGDPRYLRGHVTRYFIYARPACEAGADRRALADLAGSLFGTSRSAESLFRVVIAGDDVRVRDVPGSAILYLKLIPTPAPLLETYSTYLALTSPLIVREALLEAAKFRTSAAARRYVYQLTVIAASLYQGQCALSEGEVHALGRLIRDSPERDLETGAATHTAPDRDELDLLGDLILPLHRSVEGFLSSGPHLQTYSVLDIHSGMRHAVLASRDRVSACSALAASRYLEYPALVRNPPQAPRNE